VIDAAVASALTKIALDFYAAEIRKAYLAELTGQPVPTFSIEGYNEYIKRKFDNT